MARARPVALSAAPPPAKADRVFSWATLGHATRYQSSLGEAAETAVLLLARLMFSRNMGQLGDPQGGPAVPPSSGYSTPFPMRAVLSHNFSQFAGFPTFAHETCGYTTTTRLELPGAGPLWTLFARGNTRQTKVSF